jgi:hypothetical protein
VTVINAAFAEHLWPGEDPIGRRFRTFYGPERDLTVVGVVGDTRHLALASTPAHQNFVPMRQTEYMFGYMTVAMNSAGDAVGLEHRARAAATALDDRQRVRPTCRPGGPAR